MSVIIKAIALTIVLTSVQSLEQLEGNADALKKIIQLLSNKQTSQTRAVNVDSLQKEMSSYKQLRKNMSKKQMKQMLRGHKPVDDEGDIPIDPVDKLAEDELKHSLDKKQSALLDRTYVESEGKYDFLVLSPNVYDHFVTVIPNAIYQSIEKKCVNWLDDCSLKGIRARLLRGVVSPYR